MGSHFPCFPSKKQVLDTENTSFKAKDVEGAIRYFNLMLAVPGLKLCRMQIDDRFGFFMLEFMRRTMTGMIYSTKPRQTSS